MPIGIVKFYNRDKGFGFIRLLEGPPDVFFHVTELHESHIDEPVLGARIGYELGKSRTHSAKNDPTKNIMAVNPRYL